MDGMKHNYSNGRYSNNSMCNYTNKEYIFKLTHIRPWITVQTIKDSIQLGYGDTVVSFLQF